MSDKGEQKGFLQFEYDQAIEHSKKRSQFYDKNTFHVTDLIYCRRKQMMGRQHPEKSADVTLKPPVFNGICFEDGIDKKIRRYYESKNKRVTFNKAGAKKIGKYTVTGAPDVMVFNPVEEGGNLECLIEIKNRIYSTKLDKEYYVMQLMMYDWLFEPEHSYIWLFSSTSKHREYELEHQFSDEDILKLIENPKYPMWPWECKSGYCSFRKKCPYRKK